MVQCVMGFYWLALAPIAVNVSRSCSSVATTVSLAAPPLPRLTTMCAVILEGAIIGLVSSFFSRSRMRAFVRSRDVFAGEHAVIEASVAGTLPVSAAWNESTITASAKAAIKFFSCRFDFEPVGSCFSSI